MNFFEENASQLLNNLTYGRRSILLQKVKQFALERRELWGRAAVALALVLALVGGLAVTAFAETTYFIHDGERRVIHKTAETEPTAVLDEAGLALEEGDLITTESGFGSSTITIRRAAEVHINYYGKVLTELAYEDETLADVVARLELTWNEGDALSQSLDTAVFDGLNLAISRVEVKEEAYTAAIPFETVYVNDDSLAKGNTKVRTQGQEGQLRGTAAVTYINGMETAREVLTEEVAAEAVSQVVAVGTGKNVRKYQNTAMPVIGNGTITLATGEVLTYTSAQTFKATAYTHTDAGCDMITATGTTVRVGTVAVDPRVIPYGTQMFIITNDGQYIYGIATAEDCGGGIKGNRLDLYFPSYSECVQFGVRNCTVYFIG